MIQLKWVIDDYFKLEKNQHLIRVHIGLEDEKDLINDLKKSLRVC